MLDPTRKRADWSALCVVVSLCFNHPDKSVKRRKIWANCHWKWQKAATFKARRDDAITLRLAQPAVRRPVTGLHHGTTVPSAFWNTLTHTQSSRLWKMCICKSHNNIEIICKGALVYFSSYWWYKKWNVPCIIGWISFLLNVMSLKLSLISLFFKNISKRVLRYVCLFIQRKAILLHNCVLIM